MNIEKWIEPLSKRVKKTAYYSQNSFVRAMSIISPELVYYYVGQIVTFGMAYVIGTGSYGTTTSEFYRDNSLILAALIRIAAVIIAVLPLIPAFIREYPVLLPDKRFAVPVTLVVGMGIAFSLFFNSIAMLTGFAGSSQSFNNTATAQFSLPVWMGVIVYGLVTPLTEEIVHRGLIYNRFRRYFNLPIAVIGSSLLFGISHGNRVQLVYGFIMGLFICYVYERYGAFVYPVLFHCVANIAVYVCMSNNMMRECVTSYIGIAVEMVVAVACFIGVALAKKIDT